VEGVAWDNATTGGDNPPASDSISGGGEVGGFANHQNQNRSEWALVTNKNNYGSANQSWLVRKLHLHPDVVGVYLEAIQVFRPSGNDGNYEICTMAIGA
jgi:hypothetical protein